MNKNRCSRIHIEEIQNCILDKLVVRASRGDCHAIESITALYAPRLALEIGIIVGPGEEVPEDLVHEFAQELANAVPRRRIPRSLALPWMLRVQRRVARRHRRRGGEWRVEEGEA